MTKIEAYDQARWQADKSGKAVGVHLIGPERYTVAEFREGDEEICRQSILDVIEPDEPEE